MTCRHLWVPTALGGPFVSQCLICGMRMASGAAYLAVRICARLSPGRGPIRGDRSLAGVKSPWASRPASEEPDDGGDEDAATAGIVL